jgi:colanic acid/amylovoran/stewartan biosynthesis glycosyltransferase WcaL/AmsK/CpsK
VAPEGTVVHALRSFGELSQTFVTDLIEDLDAGGWKATVVSMSITSMEGSRLDPEQVMTARRPGARSRLADWLQLRSAADRRSAWLYGPMADARPGLVHAHFGWAAVDARRSARRLGVPLIATFHGSDLTTEPGRRRRGDYRKLFGQVDHVITVSRFLEGRIRDIGYAGPVDVVPGGVRVDAIPFRPPQPDKSRARLLFVGRQIDCKGLDVLLRALARLRLAHPGIELEVIGDGPARDANEALARRLGIAHAVDFRGSRPRGEVVSALGRSDVLVAPSRTSANGQAEGRSVVAMEGLAAGLPVVATTNGGLPETIPPAYRHELVPEGDPEALAERILAVLERSEAWEERARSGRAWAEQEFDAAGLARRVADIYRGVLANRRAAERSSQVGARHERLSEHGAARVRNHSGA